MSDLTPSLHLKGWTDREALYNEVFSTFPVTSSFLSSSIFPSFTLTYHMVK